MNRDFLKKHRTLLLLALIGVIGVLGIVFLLYRFNRNDVKAITDFAEAYDKFDIAIADYSTAVQASNPGNGPAADNLERNADEALTTLNSKASAKISSFTKNDGELMKTSLEISGISGKELDALKAYRRAAASKTADIDRLAKELSDLTNQRQTEYAHFEELLGLKN